MILHGRVAQYHPDRRPTSLRQTRQRCQSRSVQSHKRSINDSAHRAQSVFVRIVVRITVRQEVQEVQRLVRRQSFDPPFSRDTRAPRSRLSAPASASSCLQVKRDRDEIPQVTVSAAFVPAGSTWKSAPASLLSKTARSPPTSMFTTRQTRFGRRGNARPGSP
jgi:hypothetical protein